MSRFRFDKYKLAAFDKDVEAVCAKHQVHPGIIFFQPQGTREQFILWIGSPAVEWISQAGEAYMKKLELEAPLGILP